MEKQRETQVFGSEVKNYDNIIQLLHSENHCLCSCLYRFSASIRIAITILCLYIGLALMIKFCDKKRYAAVKYVHHDSTRTRIL